MAKLNDETFKEAVTKIKWLLKTPGTWDEWRDMLLTIPTDMIVDKEIGWEAITKRWFAELEQRKDLPKDV